MAFTASTYDGAERTRFFRQNQHGVPLALPFDLITVDGEQFYEPASVCGHLTVGDRGVKLRGTYTGAVFINEKDGLPKYRAPYANEAKGVQAVWAYFGI